MKKSTTKLSGVSIFWEYEKKRQVKTRTRTATRTIFLESKGL